MVMKEGVVEDFANKEKIAKLLRFTTNKSADATQTATLECYVKSMQKDQKACQNLWQFFLFWLFLL
jgi:molecular chaperone HtpG